MALLITAFAYLIIALSFVYVLRGIYRFIIGTSKGPCNGCHANGHCSLQSTPKKE